MDSETSDESALQLALGTQYQLEREIGRGGMATVYLARDIRHRREVAVKVLHAELSAALGSERFLREIELTALCSIRTYFPSSTPERRRGCCTT